MAERGWAERALRESEERYRAVVEQTVEGIFLLNAETRRVLEANAAFGELLGYASEELAGMAARDFVTQSDEELESNIRRTLEERRRFVGGRKYRRKDGSLVDVEIAVSVISYGGGEVICAAVRDVTERKKAEEELRRRERELNEAQRIASVGSWSFDMTTDRGRWSDEMYRIFGYAPQEFVVTYKRFLQLVHPEDKSLLRRAVRQALYGDKDRHSLDYRLVRPDGEVRFLHSQYEVVRDESRQTVRLVGTSQDITERKALEARLEHRVLHDPLTELPNRILFADRLGHALARIGRREGKVAVLFLDLDNFKFVNDSLGHEAGDRLLVAVSDRLKSFLRPEDTVARFGGDEFAILLEDVEDDGDAACAARRIVEKLARTPFVLDGHEVFAVPSVGIAIGDSDRYGPADLLRKADAAMYRAKKGGGSSHEVFDPGLDSYATERLGMESALRQAIEHWALEIHYQPKVELETGRIVAMEALVRWEHPERGLLSPAQFIPLAEETGLIFPLGRRVLKEACRQAKRWHRRFPSRPPLKVCVNLSARQFEHPGFVEEVADVLQEIGLEPAAVDLEITESVLMGDAPQSIATLEQLKDVGVNIAVDDFGTGYSNLSYLRRFPVDFLKVDRSLVEGIDQDPKTAAIAAAVLTLAHSLGETVIAEGVETAGQLRKLEELGCDYAQGYLFSKPLPSEAAGALLEMQTIPKDEAHPAAKRGAP